MRRAGKVNIAGRKYTISRGDTGDAWGLADAANGTISISETLEATTTLSPELIELHEVLHAILFETGLCVLVDDTIEEALVHGAAIQLFNAGYRRVV